MLKRKIIIPLLIALFLSFWSPVFPVGAITVPQKTDLPENIPHDIFPLGKTQVKLLAEKVTLNWSEKDTQVKAIYHLYNPQNTHTKLKMGLYLPTPENEEITAPLEKTVLPENTTSTTSTEITLPLQVFHKEEELKTTYNKKIKGYIWEIKLDANEEATFEVNYTVINQVDKQGLSQTGFCFPSANKNMWAGDLPAFSLVLNFQDTHPGQIVSIEPRTYHFENNSLLWNWNAQEKRENLIITANLQEEINSIYKLLSEKEKSQLQSMTSQEQFNEAASLLEKKTHDILKTEEKQILQLGQAYYLRKTNNTKKAFSIMSDLAAHDTPYPRPYWELGKSYDKRTGKLVDLLNQIQELKIHPLLQSWLMAKLPPEKIELTVPEITAIYADTNNSRKGIIIKSHLTDHEGDIARIILRYRWENGLENEVNFEIKPFQYDYDLFYFTLAPDSFKQLFYEVEIIDYAGHKISSGQKETFYLNEEIQSDTFILNGAILILGDYSSHEQDKIYKWFKSYLQITKEVGFVPVDTKSPLIVFLGKEHDFIKKFQDSLFICYTPIPFSPDNTRIQVHRYFLSYWYGTGWNSLSEKEVLKLGDALMLGKGWSAETLKYLQAKDVQLFSKLLCQIGEGKNWAEALMSSYQLTPLTLYFFTIWHIIGSYVIAFILIIVFAWLGKNGYITRVISFIKTTKILL